MSRQWDLLADIPKGVDFVYDNMDRLWERENGYDWATYASYPQRWSTAVTDLRGWGPFREYCPPEKS